MCILCFIFYYIYSLNNTFNIRHAERHVTELPDFGRVCGEAPDTRLVIGIPAFVRKFV